MARCFFAFGVLRSEHVNRRSEEKFMLLETYWYREAQWVGVGERLVFPAGPACGSFGTHLSSESNSGAKT